jgi:hypothetical protein
VGWGGALGEASAFEPEVMRLGAVAAAHGDGDDVAEPSQRGEGGIVCVRGHVLLEEWPESAH